MPIYPHGKQTEQLELSEILEKVKKYSKFLSKQQLSYFWLLYWGGMRKSELYERVITDCQTTKDFFILDITVRKKHSAQTDPLEFPRNFPGIDVVCEWLEKARKRKPTTKLLERWEKKIRITKRVKARWLFPEIHRDTALRVVKQILGKNYYPHFLRLNRLTEINMDPGSNYIRIRSFSGIKSMRVIQDNYSGRSKREVKSAWNFMAKQIKENTENESRD